MPKKLSQFWQDLKRRNVVRVITVYTGAAFVILSLVDMVREPFELPNWSFKLVIVLLSIGLIIAIILSWIYDIHPEEGIVKTEPVQEGKSGGSPTASNGWKIASYISFAVIVGLVVLNIIPRTGKKKVLETSIAVLPFENQSDEDRYSHIGGAFTDEIIMELQKIKAFDRVLPRSSTSQYEEYRPTIPEIAEKLNVNYIIDGSIQRLEGRVRVRVQVTRALNEDIIWGDSYDEEYKHPSDILDIQSRIAQSVADELKISITPEEKELIEKVPTTSLTAYDYYQRGREEYWRARMNYLSGNALDRAEYFFRKALEYDSLYALAYAGLAMVRYSRYSGITRSGYQYVSDYFTSLDLDSMNILAAKAIEIDDQIADAYYAWGMYEQEQGNLGKALERFQSALRINPNHTLALMGAAGIYEQQFDYVRTLSLLYQAAGLERGTLLSQIYFLLFTTYWHLDFLERSMDYLDANLEITGDSISYLIWSYVIESQRGNQELANTYASRAYTLDSTNKDVILYRGRSYLDSEQYMKALPFYKKYFNMLKTSEELDVNDMNRMGYVLWMTGNQVEAQSYFLDMISHCRRHIEMGSSYGRSWGLFDIAGVYAFIGEKDSAYHYLEIFHENNIVGSYLIAMLKEEDPLFGSIRGEDSYQDLLSDLEVKNQAEHERVRQWLEENDML